MELLELPFEPASASVARRHVVHVLRTRGVESAACEDAALIVSELVGNALRHGQATRGGRVLVGWQFGDDGLHIEVTDGGGGRPAMQDGQNPWSSSGRGLAIVAAVAERWGYALETRGTTVWAAVATPTATSQSLDPQEYGETG
jgi:serine/threonine-protein kinase RsbW